MNVDLLRHGELEGEPVYCGITDKPLNDTGWQQMLAACEPAPHWQRIVSSPLSRCRVFAEHLAKNLNVPLHVDARWQEMNFGKWEGLSAQEIMAFDEQKLFRFWENPLQETPDEGESLVKVQQRVLSAWQELINSKQSVLIISHGGPIRILCCHIENRPVERLFEVDVPYASRRTFSLPDIP